LVTKTTELSDRYYMVQIFWKHRY